MSTRPDKVASMAPPKSGPNLVVLLLWVILFVALALWAVISVSVGDALWFYPSFQARPSVMDLYWDGQKIRLMPSTPEYELVQQALVQELPHVSSVPVGTALSDKTLTELRQQGRILELYFDRPVRIHSHYNFGDSQVYYIPLSGFHLDQKRVFNAARGSPLELDSMDKILAAVEEVAREKGLSTP